MAESGDVFKKRAAERKDELSNMQNTGRVQNTISNLEPRNKSKVAAMIESLGGKAPARSSASFRAGTTPNKAQSQNTGQSR